MAEEKMTRQEAGRLGGQATKAKHGAEHYQRIGKKGGKRGGTTTKARYGTEFYQRIGQKGGQQKHRNAQ